MNLVRNHEVGIIDLTDLESCRMFRQQLDNSASDADTQYRSQDEKGWDEDDDWDSDEEGNTNTSWRDQFDQIVQEDEIKKQEKRRLTRGNVGSHNNSYYSSDTLSHASTPSMVSPSCSEDWSESPVSDLLGSVTYLFQGQPFIAQQTTTGGLIYEGQRFKSISDWLRSSFKKRI
eukprot:CAMPEP_0172177394 /NCGR_PEP_ID=MMETSP1050-20130122/15411_1 /TAXON_ID=233186 /ORGANISM="Cryptomonas curvata, Strain CCAP979/52" /LENGTH=173 /DNA_ID=CAMNT_0012849907 /DNA_START=131 /DNA_END=652 /DNA_ORIENTATION=-